VATQAASGGKRNGDAFVAAVRSVIDVLEGGKQVAD
jgi:hypothetical protein